MKKDKKDPVDPGTVAGTAAEARANALTGFGWATNAVKLNRAKAFVQQTTPGLTGQALEDAIRERYIELKGLLRGEGAAERTGKPRGVEVNMADNDGSKD